MSDPDAPVPITPIPLPKIPIPGHPIPLRQNIDSWYAKIGNELQVSLFIQALDYFQKMDYQDQLSYFRIAAIHGLPASLPWNGAGDKGFYCTHSEPTFATWHRPYMLLYERRLYDIMHEEIIGKRVPVIEKEIWEFAANHWRLPYWDWADNSNVPKLIELPSVTIVVSVTPRKTMDVENPLWKFKMPTGKPMGDKVHGKFAITYADGLPFDLCVATSRYGILWSDVDRDWVEGKIQNYEAINAATAAHQWDPDDPKAAINMPTIKDNVIRLLHDKYFDSYEKFTSTKYHKHKGKATDYLSLEFIHNLTHNWIGGSDANTGGGHMCSVPVAAFDPIFYLHHCNIDRLLAIWQAMNWEKWFDDPQSDDPEDPDPSPDAPLKPFRTADPEVFYTSNSVRKWWTYNYTYPEVESFAPPSDGGEANLTDEPLPLKQLKKTINHLYGRHALAGTPEGKPVDNNDYLINIVYNRHALGGIPYHIHFFIGDVDGPPGLYAQHRNHVGSIYTFTSAYEVNGAVHCENCKKQADAGTLSKAQIPIEIALKSRAANPAIPEFESAAPDAVETYLQNNLKWRVVTLSGVEISPRTLPDLLVSVAAGKMDFPANDEELINYRDYVPLHRATEGKVGGAREGDIHYE